MRGTRLGLEYIKINKTLTFLQDAHEIMLFFNLWNGGPGETFSKDPSVSQTKELVCLKQAGFIFKAYIVTLRLINVKIS